MKLAGGNITVAKLTVWVEEERLTDTVMPACSSQSAVVDTIWLLLQVLSN